MYSLSGIQRRTGYVIVWILLISGVPARRTLTQSSLAQGDHRSVKSAAGLDSQHEAHLVADNRSAASAHVLDVAGSQHSGYHWQVAKSSQVKFMGGILLGVLFAIIVRILVWCVASFRNSSAEESSVSGALSALRTPTTDEKEQNPSTARSIRFASAADEVQECDATQRVESSTAVADWGGTQDTEAWARGSVTITSMHIPSGRFAAASSSATNSCEAESDSDDDDKADDVVGADSVDTPDFSTTTSIGGHERQEEELFGGAGHELKRKLNRAHTWSQKQAEAATEAFGSRDRSQSENLEATPR